MTREWHAVRALNAALEETKSLLLRKIDVALWLKLGLVVFLIGGGGLFNAGGFGSQENDNTAFDFARYLPVIVVVLSILIIIGLVFSLIRAVCQFMFIEALLDRSIVLLSGFKRNLDKGFNLFMFNLALGFATVITLIAIIIPIAYYLFVLNAGLSRLFVVFFLALAACIIMLILLIAGVVGSLTNDFVTVIMHKEGKGVVEGWRRLYALIKNDIKEFLVYAIVRTAVGLMAAVLMFIVELIVTVISIAVAVIPAVGIASITAGIALALDWSSGMLALLLIPAVFIAILYFMVVTYITMVLTLPFTVFFRYHSMLFLHYTDPALDVMAKRGESSRKQETVRETGVKAGTSEKKLRVY